MSGKFRKIVIIAIIILIIAIIGVLIMKNVLEDRITDVIEYEGEIIVNESLEKVTSRGNYYIVKDIVENYYLALCNLNKTSKDVLVLEYEEGVENLEEEISKQVSKEIENTKNRIYNFFAHNYIQKIKLSTDNLQEKLGNYKDLNIIIEKMYVRDISGNLKFYLVLGNIIEKDTLEKENFQLMILIDEKNKTFNIYGLDYIQGDNLYELIQDKDLSKKYFDFNEIENRKYNKYQYESINDETYATDLLNSFSQAIRYNNIDYSYNMLDEEYKKKRFPEKSDYEKYIQDNKKEIQIATLDYYKKDKYDEYMQYICIDRKGNYYIFRENSIMNYSIILDTYTIDLPEFTEKYKIATTEEKVMLNIQKIVEALNAKDYKYIYSKLADEFKEKYFKDYNLFVRYFEVIFDKNNEIIFNSYTESNELSTYSITLKGTEKTVEKTIIMRLDEGTDFVISFNIK